MVARRRPSSFGGRAFRALLALYPSAFRDEYGREMALVFDDRYRRTATTGARVRLWIDAVTDLVLDVPKEHGRMIAHDLRNAWRALRRQPLVATTIVVMLGLGIGANTAIYSVLNAMTARTLGVVPHPEELFAVNSREYASGGPESARLSGPMFRALRDAAPDGVAIAAMSRAVARVYTREPGEPGTTPARLQLVSSSYFAVLGVTPALGQALPDDRSDLFTPNAAVVISNDYWRRRFGGVTDIVGRTITINNAACTIVGVAPAGFTGVWLETPVDVWAPLAMQDAVKYAQSFSADGADFSRPWLPQSQIWWLHVIVRTPAARAMEVAGRFGAAVSAPTRQPAALVLQPFSRGMSRARDRFMAPLVALFVMTGLVLLIACANVANLLVSRAIVRQRELGLRVALGAARTALVRQLLTESAVIVAIATGVALELAHLTSGMLVRAAAAVDGSVPLAAPLDAHVLTFSAAIAAGCVLLCGLWPAWRASRVDALTALRSGGRGTTGGLPRVARALVAVQVALSLVLVTGTGLFVRSFRNLLSVDPGVDRTHVLSIRIDPRLAGEDSAHLPAMYQRILDAVSATPNVRSASLAMCGLESPCGLEDSYAIEGRARRAGESIAFRVNAVSPAYFATVGTPLLAGRVFDAHDMTGGWHVAVVNRALADAYFPDGRAVGHHVGLTVPDIEIVGVVENARPLDDVAAVPEPRIFMPLAERAAFPRALEVRTTRDPGRTAGDVLRAITAAAPLLPIENVTTAAERLTQGLGRDRLAMNLTSAIGALALGLAGFGLFSLVSYGVARRTTEFGVRMALGASPAGIVSQVLRDVLWLIAPGVGIGIPLVWMAGRVASTMFFGVSAHDAMTLAAALLILVVVSVASAARPAWAASRIDPIVALRQE